MQTEPRRKTAMVLHQIEQSLGDFVLNRGEIEYLNPEVLENIHRREADKGRVFNKESIKDIIEATYLDELFRFALDLATDDSIRNSVNYLYSLFHHLDIYEVRNAVSHPNRPFWDCYWYRVATIASDPVNEILKLSGIKKALTSAEQGIITDPPDEWLHKVIWQIPNNLPVQFDHALTGLIGRTKELDELKKYVSNQRINTIALVAPGGAGKTALALDLLNNIVSTPSFTKYVDAVIYVTMKTEKLTADGVITLNSIQTIEELKKSIFETGNLIFDETFEGFEDFVSHKSDTKILLCIDNLETLLRDFPESFDDLNHGLPEKWQVLVTSRVAISNATILSLDNLKVKSAIHLARLYHSKRGGIFLGEKEYEKLTSSCFYNPLAIRLTIDLIVTGKDIPSSLDVANKEIAEFSYNNLINALSQTSIEVLEAIFVEGESSRLSLCELLNKDIDDISSAIGELSKTSLISRASSEQGESHSLSDSVRELLVISPRNIKTRNQVQDKIHKARVLSNEIDIRQVENEIPEWHIDFISKNTPENLKILVTEVNRKIKKANRDPDIAIKLYRKLKEGKYIYENSHLYQRTFGRVFEALRDYSSAEDCYKASLAGEEGDPATTYQLARLYHNTKRYQDAADTYSKLIAYGWVSDNPKTVPFGRTIYNGYCLALLYLSQYETVFDVTKKWKEAGAYRGVLGTFRASAWKRKMETLVNDNHRECVDALLRATRIMSDVFRNEGYFGTANKQAIKIMDEIEFCFSRTEYTANFGEEGLELLKFVAAHILDVTQSYSRLNFDQYISKFEAIELQGNPFKSQTWVRNRPNEEFVFHEEIPANNEGRISVRVKPRPKDKASFFFAEDGKGTSYFLHYENLKNSNWRDWCQLSTGEHLEIIPDDTPVQADKSANAREIYIIS